MRSLVYEYTSFRIITPYWCTPCAEPYAEVYNCDRGWFQVTLRSFQYGSIQRVAARTYSLQLTKALVVSVHEQVYVYPPAWPGFKKERFRRSLYLLVT